MKLKPAFNAFLNFWFRHDWELIWPLYAGLLLFQTMSRIPMRRIILFQLPFSILHIVMGLAVAFWYFRRHGIGREHPGPSNGIHATVRDFFCRHLADPGRHHAVFRQGAAAAAAAPALGAAAGRRCC